MQEENLQNVVYGNVQEMILENIDVQESILYNVDVRCGDIVGILLNNDTVICIQESQFAELDVQNVLICEDTDDV